MDNTQRIILDIRDNQTYEQIYTKQYNKGFPIEFEITKDGEPFDLSGCTATFEMKKPDKTVVWKNCDITNNIISVEVTEQMTIVDGKAEFQITLTRDDVLITTITSVIKIDRSVIQDDDIESSNEFSFITDIMVQIRECQQATTDVMNYARETKTSASNAKTSETNASTSATNASASASVAKTSETNASTSATTAATHANSAKTYANNASTSASSASRSASDAKTSETKALQSEVNAKTSETNSASSATTAENYAVGNTDSAKYYYEQSKSISESFSGALRPMGTVAFASLPSISSASEGDMYNISDEFTTTDEFKEGSGNAIPAGSNVYKTSDGYWDVLAGSPVTGVKGNAETSYRRGNVNISTDDLGIVATVTELNYISGVTSAIQTQIDNKGVTYSDGSTAQSHLGAIKGITDSLVTSNSNYALSAKGGASLKNSITSIETSLSNKLDIYKSTITSTKNKTVTLPSGNYLIMASHAANSGYSYVAFVQVYNAQAPTVTELKSAEMKSSAGIVTYSFTYSVGELKIVNGTAGNPHLQIVPFHIEEDGKTITETNTDFI